MTKDKAFSTERALKLALEALENIERWLPTIGQKGLRDYESDAITAIKEALSSEATEAQPEQEPVAWISHNAGLYHFKPDESLDPLPLYLAAQPAVTEPHKQEPLEYWNAVEGWVKIDEVREHFDSVGCGTIYKTAGDGRVPVYTAQPAAQPAYRAVKTYHDNKPWYVAQPEKAKNETIKD